MKIKLVYHGQVIAKKNNWKPCLNQRTGRLMIAPTTEAKRQEAALISAFAQGSPQLIDQEGYVVKITVWNRDRRRHDLDNQASTILDALVKAGVLPDDNQRVVEEISATYAGVDAEDPRAEITIERRIDEKHN